MHDYTCDANRTFVKLSRSLSLFRFPSHVFAAFDFARLHKDDEPRVTRFSRAGFISPPNYYISAAAARVIELIRAACSTKTQQFFPPILILECTFQIDICSRIFTREQSHQLRRFENRPHVPACRRRRRRRSTRISDRTFSRSCRRKSDERRKGGSTPKSCGNGAERRGEVLWSASG